MIEALVIVGFITAFMLGVLGARHDAQKSILSLEKDLANYKVYISHLTAQAQVQQAYGDIEERIRIEVAKRLHE